MARKLMPEEWMIPLVVKTNEGFFTSGRLVVQECGDCGNIQHPPEEVCWRCLSMSLQWRDTSGKGTIYSYIVVHNPPAPSFKDVVPYAVVIVSLDDHPHVRVVGNVVNCPAREVRIGQRVRAVFDPIDPGDGGQTILLPQWEFIAAD